jgi:hypothetical protein
VVWVRKIADVDADAGASAFVRNFYRLPRAPLGAYGTMRDDYYLC